METSSLKLLLFSSLFLVYCGCQKPQKPDQYAARVNAVYLFESDLTATMKAEEMQNRDREELLREWVKNELLYQEAGKSGILKSEKYKRLVKEAERRIAGSLLIQSVFETTEITYDDEDLENFFRVHQESFRLPHKAYYINMIVLNEEEKAIAFRNKALSKEWEEAVSDFQNDPAFAYSEEKILEFEFSLPSVEMIRVLQLMRPREISYVIHSEAEKYVVVQLLGSYQEQEIPPIEATREQIINNFTAYRREEIMRDFLDRLYSENIVEITR